MRRLKKNTSASFAFHKHNGHADEGLQFVYFCTRNNTEAPEIHARAGARRATRLPTTGKN